MQSGTLLLVWHSNMIPIMLYGIHCSLNQKNGLAVNIVKWQMENPKVHVRENQAHLKIKLYCYFHSSFSFHISPYPSSIWSWWETQQILLQCRVLWLSTAWKHCSHGYCWLKEETFWSANNAQPRSAKWCSCYLVHLTSRCLQLISLSCLLPIIVIVNITLK